MGCSQLRTCAGPLFRRVARRRRRRWRPRLCGARCHAREPQLPALRRRGLLRRSRRPVRRMRPPLHGLASHEMHIAVPSPPHNAWSVAEAKRPAALLVVSQQRSLLPWHCCAEARMAQVLRGLLALRVVKGGPVMMQRGGCSLRRGACCPGALAGTSLRSCAACWPSSATATARPSRR